MSAADQAYKNDQQDYQQANQQNPESVGNKSLQAALAKFDEWKLEWELAESARRFERELELAEYVIERQLAECNRRLERQLAEIERELERQLAEIERD